MVVQLIKPVLAPMLIAQAKRLRRVALELPEPSGERHGVARSPPRPWPRNWPPHWRNESGAMYAGICLRKRA